MYTVKRQEISPMRALIRPSLLMFAVLSVAIQIAQAQPGPSPLITTWTAGGDGSGTGNWNTGTNWSGGTVPNVTNEDSAIINGGGTAQVSAAPATNPGSVVLGQGTAANESGTLEIQSGGSLTVVEDPNFPADGSVRVGQNVGQGLNATLDGGNPNAGTGTLRVLPGGTLTSVSLTLGGTVDSSMTLGGTSAGTATVNTGSVTLGRTTRVIGPNVNFNSSGAGAGITLQGTSVLIPEITGATHSALKTSGAASLGGTVQADFNGVNPAVNQSWDIVNAASVSGNFASVLSDPDTPLGPSQILNTRTVDGGIGKLVQMFVQQLPKLTVDRNTGIVSITNPGTTSVPLDTYTIQSNSGALSVADWQSLEDNPGVAGAGWFESNPSANRLSELRNAGTSDLMGSGSWSLGPIFKPPTPTEIGQPTDDLVFQFSDPISQRTLNAEVTYTGSGTINNLVLIVDPNTGNVKIRNTSPLTVDIDGYTITSATNSLNSDPALWNSLEDQPGVAGPNWFESNLNDGRVSEIMSSGTTTLTGNSATTFDLGGLFKTAGTQDLVFEFLLAGNSQANTGVVVYETVTAIDGDYDDSGQVAQGDLDLVLLNWGKTVPPDPVPPGWINQQPMGLIGQSALDGVLLNWGNTAGSGAALGAASSVPEPATFFMLAAAVLGWGLVRRKANAA